MRRQLNIIVAIALVGGALLVGAAGCSSSSGGSAAGKAIFATGRGHAGAIPRSMMGGPFVTEGLPCAGCHGPQGKGTGIGPNITAAALGAKHTITHKPSPSSPNPQPVTEGPWTPEQTVTVVRTGTTPEGNHLGGRMPQWGLDSQDASALAEFLGQL